jgi:hypothetical protein
MREIAVREAGLDDVFIDDITFPAVDGYALGATLFLPLGAKQHAHRCGHDDPSAISASSGPNIATRSGAAPPSGWRRRDSRHGTARAAVFRSQTAWVRFRASWFKLALYLFFSSNAA